nr:NADH-quinone oxidoreductase subunit J [Candidatus Njordarchaeota archaeon]
MIDLEMIMFMFFSAGAIFSAVLAVEHGEIVYAAFSFGFASAYVAGIFLLLDALYLAVIQLAIFTGAISVLIIFGVLLIKREKRGLSAEPTASPKRRAVGFSLASSIVLLAFVLIMQVPWPDAPPESNLIHASSLEELSLSLWGIYALAVNLVGVFLLSSIIGCVVLLRKEKDETVIQYRQKSGGRGENG